VINNVCEAFVDVTPIVTKPFFCDYNYTTHERMAS